MEYVLILSFLMGKLWPKSDGVDSLRVIQDFTPTISNLFYRFRLCNNSLVHLSFSTYTLSLVFGSHPLINYYITSPKILASNLAPIQSILLLWLEWFFCFSPTQHEIQNNWIIFCWIVLKPIGQLLRIWTKVNGIERTQNCSLTL